MSEKISCIDRMTGRACVAEKITKRCRRVAPDGSEVLLEPGEYFITYTDSEQYAVTGHAFEAFFEIKI